MLEIASKTCNELSKPTTDTEQNLKKLSSDYLGLIKEIRDSLATQIQRLSEDLPYQNSTYTAKRESDISFMKIQVIHEQLNSILQQLNDNKL